MPLSPLVAPVTVPFCYLPSSRSQTFEPVTCKRAQFQVDELLKISQREDFAYFVVCGVADPVIIHEAYNSKFIASWYSKDGTSHTSYIGVKRVLREFSTPGTPTPLNHVVYSCRCHA